MAEKITYILGAGASYNAFPLVKDIYNPDGLLIKNGLSSELDRLGYFFKDRGHNNHLTKALIDVGSESKKFGNVDSFAKYLYHKGDNRKLNSLKLALTFFFLHEQVSAERQKTDNRYLNFVTSIIDENDRFPNNVKIISWNYDHLLEETCERYNSSPESLTQNASGDFVQTEPFASYYPPLGRVDNSKEYSIVHLNGICGFYLRNGIYHSVFNDLKEEYYLSETLMNLFLEQHSGNSHLMTFAWEKRSEVNRSLSTSYSLAERLIEDTTILIVIGYSFPFYNREIDNRIFKKLEDGKLRKIYFQDPQNDGGFLRNRYNPQYVDAYGSSEDTDIIHIPDTDQFYIPVEL